MKIYEKPKLHVGHNASVYGLVADAQSDAVFSADGSGQLVRWLRNESDGKLIGQGSAPWYCCTMQEQLLIAGNLKGEIWWIDPHSLHMHAQVQAHAQLAVYVLLPLSQQVCLSGGADGVLNVWDNAAQNIQSLKLSHKSIRCAVLSKDGKTIAVGASDGNIYLIDSEEFTIKHIIESAHLPSVFSVCYSACGRFLWSGGRDAHLCCWSVETGFSLEHRIPAHLGTINALVLSSDGQKLYSASRDKTIKVWDTTHFKLLHVYDAAKYGAHTASVNRVVMLADQLWSASDDNRVVQWPEH